MPVVDDRNDTEEEDMDQGSVDSEDSDDELLETSSGSEDDESSDINEEEAESRRNECLNDMAHLENQFVQLKEFLHKERLTRVEERLDDVKAGRAFEYLNPLFCSLHKERLTQVEEKLDEVKAGRAFEYLNPLAQLQEDMRIYTQVAGILRELKIQNARNQYEAEKQAALQNYESEKSLLYDNVKEDLEEKIKRLEEDRNNIDISSDLWNESQVQKKKKKTKRVIDSFGTPERRRKPVTVSGPYVVYMLPDIEIIDDWTAIKKALKQAEKLEKKKKEGGHPSVPKQERFPYQCKYEDGKLFYEGEWYNKGHHIIIDNRQESPVHAAVTAINTGEVWVKRADGNKSKLYINQLQKGKYIIRHVPY